MNNQQDTLFDLNPYQASNSNRKNPVGDWHRDTSCGLPTVQIKRRVPTLTPNRVLDAATDWTGEQLQCAIAQLTQLLAKTPNPMPLLDAIDQGQKLQLPTSVLEDWHLGYRGTFTHVDGLIRIVIAPAPVQVSIFVSSDQTLEQLRCTFCDRVETFIEQKARQCENFCIERIDSVTSEEGVTESTFNTLDTTLSPINIYTPKGQARTKHQYFRYTYRDGSKLKHQHIPGGNITALEAQTRRDEIEALVKAGRSPTEIIKVIRGFVTHKT